MTTTAISSTPHSSPVKKNLSADTTTRLIEKNEVARLLQKPIEISMEGKKIGELQIDSLLRKVYDAIAEQFGPPSRFDMTGSALATLAEGAGVINDIDISIEYPESLTPRLREFKECIHKAIGISQDPFFRKSHIPDPDFTAALLSCGDEATFWIDLTITTHKKRSHLFRKDDLRASLLPYLTSCQSIVLESTEHDPQTVLLDRKEKRIVIVRPEEINHFGWPTLLLSLAKGYTLETTDAEPILKKRFCDFTQSGIKGALKILQQVFANHGDPRVRSRFFLSAFLSLLDTSTPQLLQYIAKEANQKKSLDALFLNYAANNCLSSKEKRSQLICLAYLLDLTSCPLPTEEEWRSFLTHINKAAWISAQFPTYIETPLHEIAFAKILSSSRYNKKRCLDALYKNLTPEEMKSLLPERLQFEFRLSPDLAISTYHIYHSQLAKETRIAFLKTLTAKKQQPWLFKLLDIEKSLRPEEFPLFLSHLPEEQFAIPYSLHVSEKVISPSDVISIALLLRLLYHSKPIRQALITSAAKWLHLLDIDEKEMNQQIISAVIFLTLSLSENKTEEEKALLWIQSHLFPLQANKLEEKTQEDLVQLWPKLWRVLSDTHRLSLISALKKWGLYLNPSDLALLFDDENNPPSDRVWQNLIKDIGMDVEVRRQIVEKLLLQWEAKGEWERANEFYLNRTHLWRTDAEKRALYQKLLPRSPSKRLLYLELESPPPDDLPFFLNEIASDQKWTDLFLFLQLAIRLHFPKELYIDTLANIPGMSAEKIELLSQAPHLLLPSLLEGLEPKHLSTKSAKKLLIALLEPTAPLEALPILLDLYSKLDADALFRQIPRLIKKLVQVNSTAQKQHLAAALKIIPLQKWGSYPLQELPALLSLLQNELLFAKEEIALLLLDNTLLSVQKALQKMNSAKPFPHYPEIALLLLQKIVAGDLQDDENLPPFLSQITSDPAPTFITSYKEALSLSTTPYLLFTFITFIQKHPEGGSIQEKEKKQILIAFQKLEHMGAYNELAELIFGRKLTYISKELNAKLIEIQLDLWRQGKHLPFSGMGTVIKEFLPMIFSGYRKNDRWLIQSFDCFLDFFLGVLSETATCDAFMDFIQYYFCALYGFLLECNLIAIPAQQLVRLDLAFYLEETKKVASTRVLQHLFFTKLINYADVFPFVKSSEFIQFFGEYMLSLKSAGDSHYNYCKLIAYYIKLVQKNPHDHAIRFSMIFTTSTYPSYIHVYSFIPMLLLEGCELLLSLSFSTLPPYKWYALYNALFFLLQRKKEILIEMLMEIPLERVLNVLKQFCFRPPPFDLEEVAKDHLDHIGSLWLPFLAHGGTLPHLDDDFIAIAWLAKSPLKPLLTDMVWDWNNDSLTGGTKKVFSYIATTNSSHYIALALEIYQFLLRHKNKKAIQEAIEAVTPLLDQMTKPFDELCTQFSEILRNGLQDITD